MLLGHDPRPLPPFPRRLAGGLIRILRRVGGPADQQRLAGLHRDGGVDVAELRRTVPGGDRGRLVLGSGADAVDARLGQPHRAARCRHIKPIGRGKGGYPEVHLPGIEPQPSVILVERRDVNLAVGLEVEVGRADLHPRVAAVLGVEGIADRDRLIHLGLDPVLLARAQHRYLAFDMGHTADQRRWRGLFLRRRSPGQNDAKHRRCQRAQCQIT